MEIFTSSFLIGADIIRPFKRVEASGKPGYCSPTDPFDKKGLVTAEPSTLIWHQFSQPIVVVKVSFSSPHCPNVIGCLEKKPPPKEFHVIGSKSCSNWTTLLEVRDAKFTSRGQFQSWVIPPENRRSFNCIGLRLISSTDEKKIHLKKITMWEELWNTSRGKICIRWLLNCEKSH